MDKALITRKIERALDYVGQVRTRENPGLSVFLRDRDIQSIVLFNLMQAIQACIDIGSHIISEEGWETPSTQADVFEILASHGAISRSLAAKLIRMTGFRNRIVHEYERTDMKIVYTVWRKHTVDIESFCRAVATKFRL